MNGALPVVETSQEPATPVVPPGAGGHVVPTHFGRQHSWDASGKCTGESPLLQPAPVLPGFNQWFPPGDGGPGEGGGDGPAQSKPQIPLEQCAPVGHSAVAVHPSVQSVGGGLPVVETSHLPFAWTPAPGAGHWSPPVHFGRHTHIPATFPAVSPAAQPSAGFPAPAAKGQKRAAHLSNAKQRRGRGRGSAPEKRRVARWRLRERAREREREMMTQTGDRRLPSPSPALNPSQSALRTVRRSSRGIERGEGVCRRHTGD